MSPTPGYTTKWITEEEWEDIYKHLTNPPCIVVDRDKAKALLLIRREKKNATGHNS